MALTCKSGFIIPFRMSFSQRQTFSHTQASSTSLTNHHRALDTSFGLSYSARRILFSLIWAKFRGLRETYLALSPSGQGHAPPWKSMDLPLTFRPFCKVAIALPWQRNLKRFFQFSAKLNLINSLDELATKNVTVHWAEPVATFNVLLRQDRRDYQEIAQNIRLFRRKRKFTKGSVTGS